MLGVFGEKDRVCSPDVSNSWCIHSTSAAEGRKKNDFGGVNEALYIAFAADTFAVYEWFVAQVYSLESSSMFFLEELWKLSVLFEGIT